MPYFVHWRLSLTIKDLSLKSKFQKGILHSTDRYKRLNINLGSTDVYKNCCWIGMIVTHEKILTFFKCRLSCKTSPRSLINMTRPKPVGHGYVLTRKIRRGPDMGCLCFHIKMGEDHSYTLNAHFILAKFWTVLMICTWEKGWLSFNLANWCSTMHVKRGGLRSVRTLFAFAYT